MRAHLAHARSNSITLPTQDLERELASTRSDVVVHQQTLHTTNEKTMTTTEEMKRISKALRICIRCIPPMIRRIDELRNEKIMLWSMVKSGWQWEEELKSLAFASSKGGTSPLHRTTLRSVVIAIIAMNRLKAIGREGKQTSSALRGRRVGGAQSTPPVRSKNYSGSDFGAISGDVSFFTPQQWGSGGRSRTNTGMVDLLPVESVELDLGLLPDFDEDEEGQDENKVERVVNSVVRGDAKIGGGMHAWEGRGGGLLRDLGRGLFEWMRKGKRINTRGGEAVGNVRRGMGVMARKLLELEEMEKRGREIMGRERAGEQALNHTYISGPELIS